MNRPSLFLRVTRHQGSRNIVGRGVARALSVVLAIVGATPFVLAIVLGSGALRTWLAHQTTLALQKAGIETTYNLKMSLWPLAVEVGDVRVPSSDGGAPLLTAAHARARPKLFPLLSGHLMIAQVDVDSPRIRAIVRDGKLLNFKLPETGTPSQKGRMRAPLEGFAITDAALTLDIDGVRVEAREVDVDVGIEDDGTDDSPVVEVSARIGGATVSRARKDNRQATATDPRTALVVDDDILCSAEARVRLAPGHVLVHRLDAHAVADFDEQSGTTPPCSLPPTDPRRIDVSLSRVSVRADGEGLLSATGRGRARSPVRILERVPPPDPSHGWPSTDGWVGADVEFAWSKDRSIPDVSGSLEAHGVHLVQYALTSELHSDFALAGGILTSQKTTIGIADGVVTIGGTSLDLRSHELPFRNSRVELTNINFTSLMRDLGVHPHSSVAWNIKEGHLASLSGTLAPLKLDGDLAARTYDFAIYDGPADSLPRGKIIGVPDAALSTHVAVRADSLTFSEARVVTPKSVLEGGLCSIGFKGTIRVDVADANILVDELSPIGNVRMGGEVHGEVHVIGPMGEPDVRATIRSIHDFRLGGIPFGDVTAADVHLDLETPAIEVERASAKFNDSPYFLPTTRVAFLGPRGVIVDAVGESRALLLRDLFAMFNMDKDPRFDGLFATADTRTNVHVALGGPEDACKGGYVAIGARTHLRNIDLLGEKFAAGDMDVDLHWYDLAQGVAGADVNVRSFVLSKDAGRTGGTVLGAVSLARGGALSGNVMVQGIPLSHVTTFGNMTKPMDGTVSGLSRITGSLDEFSKDAGIVVETEMSIDALRVHGIPFGDSRLQVRMTQRGSAEPPRVAGFTGCRARIAAPFDVAAYKADTSSHGDWTLNGDLFGGTIHLDNVGMTRAKDPVVTGHVVLEKTDVGAIVDADLTSLADEVELAAVHDRKRAEGRRAEVSADVLLDHLELHARNRSKVRVALRDVSYAERGQHLHIPSPKELFIFENDSLVVPKLDLALQTDSGFAGMAHLYGAVSRATTAPELDFHATLDPLDLGFLPKVFPTGVTEARGQLAGSVNLRGKVVKQKLVSPDITGEIVLRGETMAVHGLPSALTDLQLEIRAAAGEIVTKGTAKIGAGTLAINATTPLHGVGIGATEGTIAARSLRVSPMPGASAGFDADLRLSWDPLLRGEAGKSLPRVHGDVALTSFDYTRPVDLTPDLMRHPTVVSTNVASEDSVQFDIKVRSRVPLRIHNNLIEVQLGVDGDSLLVSGTDQHFGVRGEVKALPGGRFHFQSRDYDVQRASVRFDDPTRVAPTVDMLAMTEYRRFTDSTSASGAAVAGAGSGGGGALGGAVWHISVHAFGDPDNLRIEMSSDPLLSQEDIFLLLAMGITRAELDQLQASSFGEGVALNVLSQATGADQAVKKVIPVIDDFRFGSEYSPHTMKTEPQVTVGKRLGDSIRASVMAGLTDDREVRALIEWKLSQRLSLQGTFDTINDISTTPLHNTGVDLRYRVEFR